MKFVRLATAGLCAAALASCGEAGTDLKSAAGDLAKGAKEFAVETVDTKTACMLAGQDEVICGCVQEKVGARLAPEDIKALTEIVKRAVSAGTIEAAAEEGAAAVDPKIGKALAQCAVSTAIGAEVEGSGEAQ
jgi:formylmethanofuran:tetrahydromethanopterin formyltransferase